MVKIDWIRTTCFVPLQFYITCIFGVIEKKLNLDIHLYEPHTQILYNHIMEPIQIPSVFLPRVSNYHDQEYIENVFWGFLGTQESPISNIDMVMKEDSRNGQLYYIAFVFFHPIDRSECQDWMFKFLDDIKDGKRVKLVHSHPWFWNISKNTGTKKTYSRPKILSEEDEADILKAQREIIESRKQFNEQNKN